MKTTTKIFLTSIILLVFILPFTSLTFSQGKPSVILSPDFQELKINEDFAVEVLINSDQKLVGADVRLNFDKDILEVSSVDDGDAFSKLALKAVEEGKIKITGVEEEKGKTFSGKGRLVTINFKAKDAGDTKLEIQFSQGSTTDSNLTTPQVKDALVEVQNSQFVIGTPIQRGTASVKRFLIKALPFIIFLIFLGVAGFYGYRWWKEQQTKPKNVFEQRRVPMDKPPQNE